MSGVILAVLDRPEVAARLFAAAGRLADISGSRRINVLAIRTPPQSTILASEQVLSRREEMRLRESEGERVDELKQVFEAWRSSNLATEWADVEGLADQVIGEWGRRADFIVLQRPVPHPQDQERRAIHAALFDTDRPVLVVPPEPEPAPFGCQIAIAWRDDGRTIRAVLAGLRCTARAGQVFVLAGTRDETTPPRLPDILEEHGITAALHVLTITGQQAFGEALLRTAHGVGADMLVMGAFARHPLRSLILGGVTRYMLAHADLPVLMRH
jgi:nucleotide-binding universal stress UspA family protein